MVNKKLIPTAQGKKDKTNLINDATCLTFVEMYRLRGMRREQGTYISNTYFHHSLHTCKMINLLCVL